MLLPKGFIFIIAVTKDAANQMKTKKWAVVPRFDPCSRDHHQAIF